MAIEIYMPALSPTMEKGTLAKWLVGEGDAVSAGDVIAEIETDKATMEVESIDDGKIGKIVVPEGTDDVPVGELIAVLLEEGEDESAVKDVAKGAEPKGATPPADHGHPPSEATAEPAKAAPEPAAEKPVAATAGTPTPAPASKGNGKAPAAQSTAEGERIFASPLARRMAKQMGVDLAAISGSGPKGRIVKTDVEAAAGKPKAAPAAPPPAAEAPAVPPAPAFAPPADVPYEEVKLPGMRKVIAKRMTESKTQVPHFYLTIDVALDKLLGLRGELNKKLEAEGVKLSVNDFIIRACALGLKKVPAANAMYAGDKMYRFKRQDISVAVAIEGGLITPVVRDAGSKGLAEISKEMKGLAAKAREGKLMPEDYQGGTFSLSNLGMFGIREFGAVINPPQGAILAVGAGEKRPVVDGDAVAIRTMMSCTLSVDHRVLDGAIGSEFLAAFKRFIEEPMTMLL